MHVGKIIAALQSKGVADDLVIIITSDHGENLGELGIYAEHGTADQITTRIPLILRWPGGMTGHIDTGLHYNLDLLPTLAELLSIDPSPNWDGRSFAPVVKDGTECGQEYLILGQCAHVCQRSVRFDDWIYIRTYHDGFHLFSDEMLFNIEQDPHEQFNLASKYPQICQQAVYYLNEWHDGMMKKKDSPIDPLWVVMQEGGPHHAKGHLREYCNLIKNTDREYAIEEYKRKHPLEFD
jgi:arylsulfatase A-like enzyme